MVTAQLICTFVFRYTKSRFSHDAADIGKHFFKDDLFFSKCDILYVNE